MSLSISSESRVCGHTHAGALLRVLRSWGSARFVGTLEVVGTIALRAHKTQQPWQVPRRSRRRMHLLLRIRLFVLFMALYVSFSTKAGMTRSADGLKRWRRLYAFMYMCM